MQVDLYSGRKAVVVVLLYYRLKLDISPNEGHVSVTKTLM